MRSAAAIWGLSGALEVQLSKSINRMRLRGSGSRFVHGGASLQEVVIPVLQIHKKRHDDVDVVDVEILPRYVITDYLRRQLAAAFYQRQPAHGQGPASAPAGGHLQPPTALSSPISMSCCSTTNPRIPRERELKLRFVLSRAAEAANNQDVTLRLEEQVAATTHYQTYKSTVYTLRRSFNSDFDL